MNEHRDDFRRSVQQLREAGELTRWLDDQLRLPLGVDPALAASARRLAVVAENPDAPERAERALVELRGVLDTLWKGN